VYVFGLKEEEGMLMAAVAEALEMTDGMIKKPISL
jgi:hypothetical protein